MRVSTAYGDHGQGGTNARRSPGRLGEAWRECQTSRDAFSGIDRVGRLIPYQSQRDNLCSRGHSAVMALPAREKTPCSVPDI